MCNARAVGLLVMLVVALPQSRSFAADSVGLAEKPFVHPDIGFSVRVPKAWQAMPGISSPGFEAPAKDRNEIGGLAPNVILSTDIRPGIRPKHLDDVIAVKSKQYAEVLKDFALISVDKVKVAGHEARAINFTTLVSGVLKVRTRQVWVILDDKIHMITFTTIADAWEKNAPAFSAIEATFTLP